MGRPWRRGRVFYKPARVLDFAEIPSLVDGGDYATVAIWESKSRVPRVHIARRPGPGATGREQSRWAYLQTHAVRPDVFESYCRVLELVPLMDRKGHVHLIWRKGAARGLDATRYLQVWEIRERSRR